MGSATLIALQLSLLVVAAVAAFEEVRDARRARKYGLRPFVVVSLEAEDFDFMIVVTNCGTTLARDVTITITPALETSVPDIDPSKLKLLTEGIPTLAPCRPVRMLVDSSISRDRGRFYDLHDVRIGYFDTHRRRHFEEEMALDFGVYWEMQAVRRHGLHDVHAELTKTAKQGASWKAPGELVLAAPRDDERRHFEAWRRTQAEPQQEERDEPDSSAHLTNASSNWVRSSNLFGRPPTLVRKAHRGGSSGQLRQRFAKRPAGPRVVFASFYGCLTRCHPVPTLCLLGTVDRST